MSNNGRLSLKHPRQEAIASNDTWRLVVTCTRGLEEVLADELRRLGIPAPMADRGAVTFHGDLTDVYRTNLELRSATRVLLELASGPVASRDQLYDLVSEVPWERVVDPGHTVAVVVQGTIPQFTHTGFAALVVKDAVVDRIRRVVGRRPDVDRHDPDVPIYLHLRPRRCAVGLDTSGEPLAHRGYRPRGGPAPLSESLAAGLLLLAGYEGETPFVDPLCGTGTLAIEAALLATRSAPGLRRKFAFERWALHDRARWRAIKETSVARVRPSPVSVEASDADSRAVAAARSNASAAGVEVAMTVVRRSLADLPALSPGTLLVTNPPYGHRLGAGEDLRGLYRSLGDTLKSRAAGSTAWVLGGDVELLKNIGLRPSQRIVVFNGPLECRAVRYDLFTGSGRRRDGG